MSIYSGLFGSGSAKKSYFRFAMILVGIYDQEVFIGENEKGGFDSKPIAYSSSPYNTIKYDTIDPKNKDNFVREKLHFSRKQFVNE